MSLLRCHAMASTRIAQAIAPHGSASIADSTCCHDRSLRPRRQRLRYHSTALTRAAPNPMHQPAWPMRTTIPDRAPTPSVTHAAAPLTSEPTPNERKSTSKPLVQRIALKFVMVVIVAAAEAVGRL